MTNVLILLFSEIARVRASLFQINGVRKEPLQLPEPDGETVTLNEKVYVPVKEHPDVSQIKFIFAAVRVFMSNKQPWTHSLYSIW